MKLVEVSTGASRFDRLETMAYVIATALKKDTYKEKKYVIWIGAWDKRKTVTIVLEKIRRFLWLIPMRVSQEKIVEIRLSETGTELSCAVHTEQGFDLVKKELEKFCEDEKKISSDQIEVMTINKEFEKSKIHAELKEVSMTSTPQDGTLSLPEVTSGDLSISEKTKGTVSLVKTSGTKKPR